VKCASCAYEWKPRVENPKACPRCKARTDSKTRRIYCLKYRDLKTNEIFWPSFADSRERGDWKRSNEGRVEILNEWNEVVGA
jgi:hypothetical protein